MNQELTDLLQKKQKQSAAGAPINWDERRDKYLAAIESLYGQIETILAEPIRHKAVMLQRRPKELVESYIGAYRADDLIILIGDEQVRFSPRGRNIVGADGRIDVIGERNEAALIHRPESGWGFLQSRQPALRVVPFDESAFADVLKLVMRD